MQDPTIHLTAFAAFKRIAFGSKADVLRQLRAMPPAPQTLLRIFDDATGTRLDFDLRPGAVDAGPDGQAPVTRAVGRPKLGVVAREVTLLPRHWDWLASQQGGASVALRKLVEDASRQAQGKPDTRTVRESAYRFMSEMGGDLPGFEEASRALFADDKARFESLVSPWPEDVKNYLTQLAAASWKKA
ncbi:MAG: DUF2239 family protein [Pseudomonadota bacterium]